MYAGGANSQSPFEPVAVTNTTLDASDWLHPRWRTLTTLSDADTITSIEIVHVDCMPGRVTYFDVTMTILQGGDAKAYSLLRGVLPFGYRASLLLLEQEEPAAPSTEQESAPDPMTWGKWWQTVSELGKDVPSLLKQQFGNGRMN